MHTFAKYIFGFNLILIIVVYISTMQSIQAVYKNGFYMSTFKTVYTTTVHLLLIQAVYLLYTSGSFPLQQAAQSHIAQYDDQPRYDVQTYNDLIDKAEREAKRGQ